MSTEGAGIAPRSSAEFVESAVLETLIPHASHIDIEAELRNGESLDDDDDASPLSSIAQRRLLYFDETLDVYVILRLPYQEENVLTSYLSRLSITLEAHALNQQQPPPSPPPPSGDVPPPTPIQTKDLIYSGTVNETEEPLIIVHGTSEGADDDGQGHVFAIWKATVFLGRPRVRIQDPVISFAATANLKPAEQVSSSVREEEYLPPLVPAGLNLLESFQDDPAMANGAPRLSALRVSRVVPTTPVTRELLRPLRNSSQQSFRAVPAVSARVRYSKVNSYSSKASIIASVDFEVTPVAECNVLLERIDLRLAGGTCEDLMAPQGVRFPLQCSPKDDVTFLYRLIADEGSDPLVHNMSSFKSLELFISATAFVSEDCRPNITMRWRANVDLSATVNPSFAAPGQSLQRSRRPTNLPVASSTDTAGSKSSTMGQEPTQTGEDFGITLSISGPASVHPGQPFTWMVFIVNRSNAHRKLALVPIPNRRKPEIRTPKGRPTSSAGRGIGELASAVADENFLYAMQRGATVDPAELLSLSADVRVGPLAPGACHTTALRFLALAVGVLHVEAVRVVDLLTQQTMDILDLPTVVSSSERQPPAVAVNQI